MSVNDAGHDDATHNLDDYADADYIPADAVRNRTAEDDDRIDAIIRDNDRFGNVLKAILFGDDEVAFATRRDDCYNEDGTRPSWSVRQMGELKVIDAPEPWKGVGNGEVIEWTFSGAIGIEDFEHEDGNLGIDLYDPYEDGRMEVTLALE